VSDAQKTQPAHGIYMPRGTRKKTNCPDFQGFCAGDAGRQKGLERKFGKTCGPNRWPEYENEAN